MNISQAQLSLIGDIYDSAIDPDRWPDVLDRVAKDVGAGGAVLVAVETLDPSYFSITTSTSEFAASDLAEFNERFHEYEAIGLGAITKAPAGDFVRDQDVWADEELTDIRPDIAWLRQHGLRRRGGMRLNSEKAWFDIMTLQFAQQRDNIRLDERERLSVLWPHLARTVTLGRGFSVLKSRFNAVLGALDKFHMAMFLVLPSGTLIHNNKAADQILSQENGVSIGSNGLLTLTHHETSSVLRKAIRDVSETAAGRGLTSSVVLKAHKHSGGDPFLVEVSPLRDANGDIDRTFRGALVCIIDPDDRVHISTTGLKELYGLTKAESSVARFMVEGYSGKEIAEMRSVALETIRSQQKAVLQKTGVSNRTELVRLALTVNLPISSA